MNEKTDKELILELIDGFLAIPNVDDLPASNLLNMLRLRLEDPYSFMEQGLWGCAENLM